MILPISRKTLLWRGGRKPLSGRELIKTFICLPTYVYKNKLEKTDIYISTSNTYFSYPSSPPCRTL